MTDTPSTAGGVVEDAGGAHGVRPGDGLPADRADARPSDAGAPGGHLTRPSDLVVAVVGPTASGKSDLALALAEALPAPLGAGACGEIIGSDAFQLYRGMDIGTAKTPLEERRGIPHHQIDVLDVREEASVAAYQRHARADVAAVHARGGVAVVAGGSGLYQRALLDVIDFPGTDPAVRARLEAEARGPLGTRGMHERLAALDPEAAARIDPHNERRIVRALEVIELTGRPFSASMPEKVFRLPTVMIALRRDAGDMESRIALRTRTMFRAGLVEETRSLVSAGLRGSPTASRATGYAQALGVIDGVLGVDEAVEQVALATRQLARRQVKWLRPDERVHWLDVAPEEGTDELLPRALALVMEALEG